MFFLEGELDPATVPLMHTAIGEAISRGGPLTIDMSDVSFVDSSGVGAILKYVKALPSGCIILHGVHNGVGKLMNIMGVEHPPKLHVIPCTLGASPAASGGAVVDPGCDFKEPTSLALREDTTQMLLLGVTAPDVGPGESGLAGDVRYGHFFEETFRRCNGVSGIESSRAIGNPTDGHIQAPFGAPTTDNRGGRFTSFPNAHAP